MPRTRWPWRFAMRTAHISRSRGGREVHSRAVTETVVEGRLSRTFSALRYRDFRLLWLGAITSTIGTFMQTLAQAWLVYTLTGSPLLLCFGGVFSTGPLPLFSLL